MSYPDGNSYENPGLFLGCFGDIGYILPMAFKELILEIRNVKIFYVKNVEMFLFEIQIVDPRCGNVRGRVRTKVRAILGQLIKSRRFYFAINPIWVKPLTRHREKVFHHGYPKHFLVFYKTWQDQLPILRGEVG